MVALLVAGGVGAALWSALADGSGGPAASRLSVARLAGERLITGFSGGHAPKAVRRMIHRGELAGVILFTDNLGGRRHSRRLIRRLQAIPRPEPLRDPLLVMIDQEGGLVKRLAGPPSASAGEMGRRGPRFSRRQGARTGRSLAGVGVNVDLAPVLDVGRPGSAIRAEHRSFGGKARRVGATAMPFARALQRHGVVATGKHFPGLGAAPRNTDVAVQRIELSRRRLRRVDERPYGPFAAAHGGMVMLSTAIYPSLSSRPAAFSRRIATRELRSRIDFGGVSITDSLQTASAQAFGSPARAGFAAAKAGTDLLLFTGSGAAKHAARALRKGLRSGRLDRGPFEGSAQRVLDLRATL